MSPKSRKNAIVQENIEPTQQVKEVKEKKIRKLKKNVESVQEIEVKEEVKSVVQENLGKKIMKNELLKEINEHKHLNMDAKKFLTNFFVNYKYDFIYEENYNQLINNIINLQEKKTKLVHLVNHLNLKKQYKNEHNKRKFKFYKHKASKPILLGNNRHNYFYTPLPIIAKNNSSKEESKLDLEELDLEELDLEELDLELESDDEITSSNEEFLKHLIINPIFKADNNDELPESLFEQQSDMMEINHDIKKEEETCFSASLQDLLSLYLYKIYLAKDKKEESDTKSILPNDNHSEYFYSYFVIQLNNNIVKLAPYVVKIDKYFNFKNEVFKNTFMNNYNCLIKSNDYENDRTKLYKKFNKKVSDLRNINAITSNFDTLENIYSQQNDEFLIKAYIAEFRNKYINYSKISTNSTLNLLFNDANLYNAILNNSILDHIQYRNKNDKNYILNNFLQLFDNMDNKEIYFNMIDISYVQEFYNFYLELYGEKNIKSIQFLWDFDSDVF